ncbi:hypothetical protein [Haloferax sp. DFSO52]|uniref:hypothetical protein n=1 Tax=Haloferax sp. DFSO52 TaxID=3388505 RepID=UPI003A8C22B4
MAPSWAPAGSDDSDSETGPVLDDRPGFGGASEAQRRDKIVSLVDARPQTPYTVGELTVALAEWFEFETDGMVPTDEEIHSILFDFDLPQLEATNRIVFDRETGRVFSVDAADALVSSDARATGDSAEDSHSGPTTVRTSDTATKSTDKREVPAQRVAELGILLFGVAGVALAGSNVAPFDTSAALVPAVVVVLFFGYRALDRR